MSNFSNNISGGDQNSIGRTQGTNGSGQNNNPYVKELLEEKLVSYRKQLADMRENVSNNNSQQENSNEPSFSSKNQFIKSAKEQAATRSIESKINQIAKLLGQYDKTNGQ